MTYSYPNVICVCDFTEIGPQTAEKLSNKDTYQRLIMVQIAPWPPPGLLVNGVKALSEVVIFKDPYLLYWRLIDLKGSGHPQLRLPQNVTDSCTKFIG